MAKEREKAIIRTGVIGIGANIVLSLFKFIVGILSSSLSVILDGINNLSDAFSSAVTIAGVKLSAKKPDKKHPLGYGRVEYLSTMLVAIIILYAGITSLKESIKGIIKPQNPEHAQGGILIIAFAVLIKVLVGLYTQKQGKVNKSDALVASGKDALFDAIISFSVLVAAFVYHFAHINLEAYLGVMISVFILKAGIEMIIDAANQILGLRIEGELSKDVKACIASFDEVYSVHDLLIHNYGPEYLVGSVHIEISEKLSAKEIDDLERQISDEVYSTSNVIMSGISIYAKNESDENIEQIQNKIKDIL